ncbi:MAG: hypothetical protein KatS3mg064_1787 [Tepidiforma sp.]|nr:hypothetical protein [Tepidiforma sp.]GIW18630.1 MAG: hypothetical protein KatS3mg064_1787 [Tepidiforma sp.]
MVLTNVAVALVALATGHDFRARDVGDTFEKAARIAQYAADRLAAAQAGAPLPEPPDLLADQSSLQVLFIVTAVSQAAIIAYTGIITGLTAPRAHPCSRSPPAASLAGSSGSAAPSRPGRRPSYVGTWQACRAARRGARGLACRRSRACSRSPCEITRERPHPQPSPPPSRRSSPPPLAEELLLPRPRLRRLPPPLGLLARRPRSPPSSSALLHVDPWRPSSPSLARRRRPRPGACQRSGTL